MVTIHKNWKAFVAQSSIDEVVIRKNSIQYILSSLHPGEAYAGISFRARKGEYVLPKGTAIEAVFLGEAIFQEEKDEENELVDVLTAIVNPAFLQGVKLPSLSPYFKEFKKEEHFATGVVYDASEKNPAVFYQKVPAPQIAAREAHRLLYNDTQDLRELPSLPSFQDTIYLIGGRVEERLKITQPPIVSARGWEDINLGTVFFESESL